jgi:hypothetical protein
VRQDSQLLARLSRRIRQVAAAGPPTFVALVTLVAGSALYGATLGSWHGARLALYCAIKLPVVLIGTATLTFPFQWIAARLCGVPLRLAAAAGSSVRALAVASLVLAALAPVAALFIAAAPPPGTGARTSHNLLYLMHTAVLAAAGMLGAARLNDQLRARAPRRAAARAAFVLWVATFAGVAGEVAWILRPFVGSVYLPLQFLRPDALDGNVYEFIWTDILPHLVSGRT